MDRVALGGLRVAIYARFSSDMQSDASIDDQVRVCRKYVEAHGGCASTDLTFGDRATSGASMDRPSFERMMRLVTAKPRGIDVIVTEDLSRIGRDSADLHVLNRLLDYEDVRLIGISDGIDTQAKNSKLLYGVKSLVASIYLDDLRDKTLRGLEGRALAGFSTGGLPYGYQSQRIIGTSETRTGSVVEIAEEKAKVVRRIFQMYLDGKSLAAIATQLNREAVPSPRAETRSRYKGLVHTTVRAFLRNEAYVGKWKYKEREWRKAPGTNKRRPFRRDDAEVIRQERPHLRIIDPQTWSAVQTRLQAIRDHYTKGPKGEPKGRAISGRATPYLLSGLLFCGACGGPMVISGGSTAAYYRCAQHLKRGTCTNGASVREDVARASVLAELKAKLGAPNSVLYARKRVVERLGSLGRARCKAHDHARRARTS